MQNIRIARLEADYKKALTEILFRLGYSNISIEGVIFSRLKDHATVEITTSNGYDIIQSLKVLKNISVNIKYYLPKYIALNKVPHLRFIECEKVRKLDKLNELFNKINS